MKIPILMYHQIDAPPPKGTALRGLIVAPKSFAWQMRMLRVMGYRGLSMQDLMPYLQGKKIGKVVGITFDDGFQNNLQHALPVLKKNGFTATCYGVSRQIGGSNVWDLGKVAPKPLMTQTDWKTWVTAGMDVGSHTCDHANLPQLTEDEAFAQISLSRHELEQAIGCEVRHFCYPYGWYKAEHAQMVRDTGYTTATTTKRGRAEVGADLFTLQRIMVARATNPLQFFLKIATTYEDKRA
ncbi:polysaccharide deacetylase family protein [Curvibacter sp. CHRR-16]|uniref:polysaccharide deacetylase family protein n=1 Tax=Curvibacter sp. CHRR-16 TaxID=2835872 RepID=UPI001BD92E89|nr:polysaccharide deacetylase family protein [Curvibacter sp. CHRR-16]MBT0571782.1 polysaccharide deacetylase family protein [Curvibacter sp. CHRR-16]